jgi:transposase
MIGMDIAKYVFQVHGADTAGHVLFRKRDTRAKLLGFLAAQTPCVVTMEACAGAHYWAREIGKLGHRVRLIAPAYVKPFVKRQKNDAADAEAIRHRGPLGAWHRETLSSTSSSKRSVSGKLERARNISGKHDF